MQPVVNIHVESVGRTFFIHYLSQIVYNASHEPIKHHKKKEKKKKKKENSIKKSKPQIKFRPKLPRKSKTPRVRGSAHAPPPPPISPRNGSRYKRGAHGYDNVRRFGWNGLV
eukprot:609117_1